MADEIEKGKFNNSEPEETEPEETEPEETEPEETEPEETADTTPRYSWNRNNVQEVLNTLESGETATGLSFEDLANMSSTPADAYLQQQILQSQVNLRKLEKEMTDAKSDLRNVKNELNVTRYDLLQLLAIFVALFTFVSIEFQLFKSSQSFGVVPLSMMFIGGLLFFVLLIHMLIIQKTVYTDLSALIWRDFKKILFLIIVLGLFVVGTIKYENSKSEYEKNIQKEIENNSINSVCEDIKEKISENELVDANDEVEKLKNYYAILLCEKDD